MYIFFMRISIKKCIFVFSILFLQLCLTGCPLLEKIYELFPKKQVEETTETTTEEEPLFTVQEIKEPEPVIVTEVEPEPETEALQEPLPAVALVEDTIEPEIEIDEEEYLRSIDNLDATESVSKIDFTQDKNAILNAISDLSGIMESKDVNKWLEYIEPSSIEYYSNQLNLRKAQKKLPNKSIVLKNISDYFNNVFIPSRQRSQVDEIRYISKNTIKAVQVKEDKSIVVYYYFTKIGNKWLVQLPRIN